MNIGVPPKNTGEFLVYQRNLHLLEKDCFLSGVSFKAIENEMLKPDVKFSMEIDHRRAGRGFRDHFLNVNSL